jgi:hypothetical protein
MEKTLKHTNLEGIQMTLQERELLTSFLQQMTLAQAGQKDPEAEALIREASAKQPDTAYLLVQRSMGLEYALQAANAETARIQGELNQLRSTSNSSFLKNANTWGKLPTTNSALAAAAGSSVPMQSTSQQRPPSAATPASSWGSGMLGTVATTAAGVVAGSFLFQGIQGLMGHHNPSSNTAANPQPAESNKMAANNEEPVELTNDTNYFADAGSSDFDASDSA